MYYWKKIKMLRFRVIDPGSKVTSKQSRKYDDLSSTFNLLKVVSILRIIFE